MGLLALLSAGLRDLTDPVQLGSLTKKKPPPSGVCMVCAGNVTAEGFNKMRRRWCFTAPGRVADGSMDWGSGFRLKG